MNPFKLEGVSPNGKPAHVWGCGICLHVCLNEDHAKTCCVCSYCGNPIDGEDKGKRQTYHRECQRKDWAQKDADRMDKAEKLESWNGGVFWGDNFYPSVDEAIESMECDMEEADYPEYLYIAKRLPPPTLDAEYILQNLDENFGAEDEITYKGDKEFAVACAAFNELNKDIEYYTEDRTRAVKITKEKP